MKKETSYEVKRELYFKKVGFGTEDDLYVFKDKRITPWDEVVIQGICDKKEIDDFHNNKYIKQVDKILLHKKDEYHYSNRINLQENWDPILYRIINPYDYIEDKRANNLSLYAFDYYSDALYDIKGELLPRGIFISNIYLNGSMMSKRYDLEKVPSKILDLPNVKFIRESDKKLLDIPYGYIGDYV